jgi:hypothetical protein
MNTFQELYEFIQIYDKNDIISWLEDPWQGKDKQESLLRLFAGLGLITKLNKYYVCDGNFNLKTISKISSLKNIFYDKQNNLLKLKDKGSASDLTCISKDNEKHLLLTTSKNLNKMNIGKLDIDKILTNFQQYEIDGYIMSLCICIRSIDDFNIMKKGIEKTNKLLKSFLDKEDTIIIDWNDLNEAYHQFKLYFTSKSINSIINLSKDTRCFPIHQELGALKTLIMKSRGVKNILWGHIQRSGKSYIICYSIILDSLNKNECNYLIITTAPNETISQLSKVVDCNQLNDFNIIILNGKNKKPILTKKNIIICSKHFLQRKINKGHDKQKHNNEVTNNIAWLKKLSFDLRFVDESHNGGTTELTKKTLDYYGKNACTVLITATYSKPIYDYNIPKENWILWDLEDIFLCKNITKDGNIDKLIEKHGIEIKNIIAKYSYASIITEYSKYPELQYLTDELDPNTVLELLKKTENNNYGWSSEACFLLKQFIENNNIKCIPEFQNDLENLKLWYRIFGKTDKSGIPDDEYPDNIVFMKRIEKICNNPETKSRFMGQGDFANEPMIIMAFLPQNNIDQISVATTDLLQKHNVIPDYEIISINSKITNNPKQMIEDARIKARIGGKKGVLVLSGKQCSLGVSIDNCDIVLLLNTNSSFDMIYQMMFRCMTEGKNKNIGFIVDLNIHRAIGTSFNYASLIKPELHPKESIKYIMQTKLININPDHWMPSFGNNNNKINILCENIYNIYSSNTERTLEHYLNRLNYKTIIFTKDEQKLLNTIFSNSNPTKEQKQLINDINLLKKGIEKICVDNNIDDNNIENENKADNNINYMNILKPLTIYISLFTIHNNDTSIIEMFNYIKNNKYSYNILIDQTKIWWGKNTTSNNIQIIINLYIKYIQNDKEINQIIRVIKELFIKNINNSKELSKLIDKYIIPQELEKKNNAEIPTPFKLRQEMLDKIPLNFWTTVKKVFEPCAGKGGFVLDIIDKFMIGLQDTIPDEKIRYKIILEKCLYFNDINPANIFICKLLIDPYNEYKLNYSNSNTLKLNIKNVWGINGFDAIIGNPPYEAVSENGVSKGGGNNLYTKFIYFADNNINDNGYILFINPPTYFSPGRSNNKNDMNLRKDIFDKYYYHCINLEECAKYFNVGSKFIYYLIQKQSNKNDNVEIICKYKKKIYTTKLNQNLLIRDYLPYLLTNESLIILDKVKNNNNKLLIFNSTIFDKRRPYVLNKQKNETDEDYKNRALKNEYIYPIKATSIQTVYSSKKCKNQNNKKVLMSESGYLKPFYDNGILGVGGHCFACLVKDELEGNKIIQLLNTKLYTFYIETNKWSGFHNKEVLQDLPNIINEIKEINNENVYKYFNISEKEIKFIEDSSKDAVF